MTAIFRELHYGIALITFETDFMLVLVVCITQVCHRRKGLPQRGREGGGERQRERERARERESERKKKSSNKAFD